MPKFNLKFGGRDYLGNNLSSSQFKLCQHTGAFSDFSAYDLWVIEIRFINFFFQAYIIKSSKVETSLHDLLAIMPSITSRHEDLNTVLPASSARASRKM